MSIGQILRDKNKNSGGGYSFEFFPPKSEQGWRQLKKTIQVFQEREFKPLFISITETGIEGGDSDARRKLTFETVERVQGLMTGVPVVPHITGRNLKEGEIIKIIVDYYRIGINNFFILRGDRFGGENIRLPYANQLVEEIAEVRGSSTNLADISVGVALYPEKHPEAERMKDDFFNACNKMRAGADFAITQFFVDTFSFIDLRKKIEREKINIPVIPGIMLAKSAEKFILFCDTNKVNIPEEIRNKMRLMTSPDEWNNFIISATIEQIDMLRKNGTNFFHIYTLNDHTLTCGVLDESKF